MLLLGSKYLYDANATRTVKLELERRSYGFPKFVCACYKINWVINSSMGFMLKQCYQAVDNINTKLWEPKWTKKELVWIFYELNKFLELVLH